MALTASGLARRLARWGVQAAIVGLAACGGGGGDSGTPADSPSSTTSGSPLPSGTGPMGGGTGETPVAMSAAFQVNTSAAGAQLSPALAALSDGGFVIAWHRDDPQGNGIFARRFAADGSPTGDEIRIDEPVTGRVVETAKVVGLDGGGYVVTWRSHSPDFDQWAVAIRHVRADGSLSAVREDVVTFFHTYDLVSLAGGGYGRLLQGSPNPDNSGVVLVLDRFGADDTFIDTQLVDSGQVLQTSAFGTVLADGRRLVSWARSDVAQGGGVGLFFQFMSAGGTLDPVTHPGGEVSGTFNASAYQSAALRDGSFVIVGTDLLAGTSNQAALVQRFGADGTLIGSRIRVDDEADVAALGTPCTFADQGGVHPCPFPMQTNATVAGTADGGFVVAWDTQDRQRPGNFVYLRTFDAQGNPLGVPARADAANATPESMPEVRGVGQGFVVTWMGQDADQSGIFARDFSGGTLQ
ncbi:hypothetical protein [Ramlibacter humi]|uniref:DUF3466 family protein n=1 Tax=Ramlibacter humi TaxID=2530451 RepID=A0A4Z0BMA1_9BURK|nr:hypothetical protein [Ramlibacter humi]TFY99068.1 hypothetical protein EZ216_16035 [Ramlibacter humi]